uniref:Uncharacterized protein n=1 Tax=Ditylenchus dipsaci TaxID=166011 RepID=A0A915DGK2_9BILA
MSLHKSLISFGVSLQKSQSIGEQSNDAAEFDAESGKEESVVPQASLETLKEPKSLEILEEPSSEIPTAKMLHKMFSPILAEEEQKLMNFQKKQFSEWNDARYKFIEVQAERLELRLRLDEIAAQQKSLQYEHKVLFFFENRSKYEEEAIAKDNLLQGRDNETKTKEELEREYATSIFETQLSFLMLLVAKVAVVRQASALPKARPNKDEAVKIEVEVFKESSDKTKNNLFAAPVSPPSIKRLFSINDEVPVKKVAKETIPDTWKKMAPDSLLGVYLQMNSYRRLGELLEKLGNDEHRHKTEIIKQTINLCIENLEQYALRKGIDVGLGVPPPATPAAAASPAGATPPAATPPAATPPAGTPPAGTPPVATPPAGTPPVATPPVATPPAATPPVATPPAATPPAATPPAGTPPVATPLVATPLVATLLVATLLAVTPPATPPAGTPPVATPPVATPPVATPPVATPPVATPPAATPPAATPPAGTPPVATPPVATPLAGTPPVATPPVATPLAGTPPAATPAAATTPAATTPAAATPAVATPAAPKIRRIRPIRNIRQVPGARITCRPTQITPNHPSQKYKIGPKVGNDVGLHAPVPANALADVPTTQPVDWLDAVPGAASAPV